MRPERVPFPEARPFRGREEFGRFLAAVDQGWEGGASVTAIREIFPVGDLVVARSDWGGQRPRQPDRHTFQPDFHLIVRDRRIVKIEWFFDHVRALKAVELEE